MIVVTGATGNIGRELVAALAGEQVVAVSRRLHLDGLSAGVRHGHADLGRAVSLRPVLEGAKALFLLLGGELNAHGESPEAVVEVAKQAGVGRIVLVSSQVSATRPEAASHDRLRAFERAVRISGLDFTLLRPSGFASNAFAWAESVRTRRSVFAPFAEVPLPVVDPADIAAVAATALREDGHTGRTYELTGPALVTPRQQAEAIGTALGEPLAFVELSRAQAHEHLAQLMPEEVVDGTLDILGAPLPAEQRISPDIELVLGRPARPFSAWAERNLPAFR